MSNIDDTMNRRRLEKADIELSRTQFIPRAEVELLLQIAEARVIMQGDRNVGTPTRNS